VTRHAGDGDEPQELTVVFRKRVRPGTPEAEAVGCLCRFETNLEAGFLASELDDGNVILIIHKDCPVHEIVRKPMDDAIGE
jgi:hypothetical protein